MERAAMRVRSTDGVIDPGEKLRRPLTRPTEKLPSDDTERVFYDMTSSSFFECFFE
jgi:hypothetical protein